MKVHTPPTILLLITLLVSGALASPVANAESGSLTTRGFNNIKLGHHGGSFGKGEDKKDDDKDKDEGKGLGVGVGIGIGIGKGEGKGED
ncbi:hypothetical protein BJX99DRAFT_263165, partial [Aspergillus californicus]